MSTELTREQLLEYVKKQKTKIKKLENEIVAIKEQHISTTSTSSVDDLVSTLTKLVEQKDNEIHTLASKLSSIEKDYHNRQISHDKELKQADTISQQKIEELELMVEKKDNDIQILSSKILEYDEQHRSLLHDNEATVGHESDLIIAELKGQIETKTKALNEALYDKEEALRSHHESDVKLTLKMIDLKSELDKKSQQLNEALVEVNTKHVHSECNTSHDSDLKFVIKMAEMKSELDMMTKKLLATNNAVKPGGHHHAYHQLNAPPHHSHIDSDMKFVLKLSELKSEVDAKTNQLLCANETIKSKNEIIEQLKTHNKENALKFLSKLSDRSMTALPSSQSVVEDGSIAALEVEKDDLQKQLLDLKQLISGMQSKHVYELTTIEEDWKRSMVSLKEDIERQWMESNRALQVQLENEWLSTMNQYKEEAADHQRCMDELRSTHRQSLETIESLQNSIKQLTSHSTVHSVDALHDPETIIDRNIDEDSREVSKLRHDYEISSKRSHQLWSSPRMVFSLVIYLSWYAGGGIGHNSFLMSSFQCSRSTW